ncbi:MAG TPA: caspase family protein, partial [Xanthomonadales bacterium]|nr:caspase family protein [Xanthomonadales bacterium]
MADPPAWTQTSQAGFSQAPSATLNRKGLLVGINAYSGGITPLSTAAGDARAVSELLARDHGYAVTCLADADATADAILRSLEGAAQSLGEADGFLFYFAGHGVALGDGNEGPQGYLLAAEARATDESTWLSMDQLRQAIERLTCRHVLVVLDCCFAGTFRWSSSRDAVLVGHPLYDSQFARYLDGEAWHALTSAAHDQRAADTLPGRRNTRGEVAPGDHSPFAAALLRGLSGAADTTRARHPPDGVITATELYQYLFEELTQADAGMRQTPGLWPLRPTNVGEYIFLNPAAALNTLPDPPLDDQNNPWLGLRAYTAADAGLFFGRRRVIDALIARVGSPHTASLLVVVGASGTGKSSVVKAGLLPALRAGIADGQAWQIVEAPRLRSDPMTQLAQALQQLQAAAAGGRQLLLFDQFEELYTQCKDAALRDRFLAALRALVDRTDGPLVVLTLR